MKSTDGRTTITEAALRLGQSYHQTQRLLLIGRLTGGRDESNGRWYVDTDSLDREELRRAQLAAAMPVDPGSAA